LRRKIPSQFSSAHHSRLSVGLAYICLITDISYIYYHSIIANDISISTNEAILFSNEKKPLGQLECTMTFAKSARIIYRTISSAQLLETNRLSHFPESLILHGVSLSSKNPNLFLVIAISLFYVTLFLFSSSSQFFFPCR